ncbi:unnamed protein product [Wuchereria bancrofti]|uniref:Uncharacterized protein n=1 Tax=Wuchereria bancrofti TaxID=6293 RepID=A0A3P7FQS5_WUCBA|nr:unnamed protein product [Wuchereria bancrofti]
MRSVFNFVEIWALFLSIAMLMMSSAIICNIHNRFISIDNEVQKTFTIKTGHKTNTLRAAKYERSILIQAMTSDKIKYMAVNKFHDKVLMILFLAFPDPLGSPML